MTFTPPHSLEAETAVLGACLLSPQACQTAVDTLTPEDFYRTAHGQVFSAVVEQYERGRVDTVTVTELLSDRGRLDEVGGPVAVHDLTDTTPSPAAVEHYARIVADKARRRAGIEQARRFAASLSEADDVDESVDALVEQLTTRRGTSTVVDKDRVAGDFIRALGDGNLNPTFASGWSSLDRLWQLPQAALTTVTGLPSSGKALALTTPIPTPTGWTTMGELSVGDRVLDDRGNPCTVVAATEVMTDHPCFEMSFADGTSIVADADHKWLTRDRAARMSAAESSKRTGPPKKRGTDQSHKRAIPAVRSTKEIAETLMVERGRRNNHSVPVPNELQLPEIEVPIDPYVLGVWLGDGFSQSAQVSIGAQDLELVDHIRSCGTRVVLHERGGNYVATVGAIRGTGVCSRNHQITPGVKCVPCGNESSAAWRRGDPVPDRPNRPLSGRLRELDLLGNKHIPSVYLRGSAEQRLALLQGLMDTDGTISSKGNCSYTSTSQKIAEGVLELAVSLGIRARIREGRARLSGRDIGPKWDVSFTTTRPVFRLSRKLQRLPSSVIHDQWQAIVGCDPVPSEPVRCIQVDSPSKLFLAGPGMVPTHNSTWLDVLLWRILQRNDDARVAYFSPEQGPSEDHLFELVTTWLGRTPQGTDGQRVDEAMRWWLDRIDWIDDVRDNTPSAVLSVARRMSPDILVVDPYNNLAPDLRNRGERQDLVIQDLLRRFRRFARDTGCAVVIVAHPRQTEQVAGTQNVFKVPTAAHISGGQEWWNASDTVITVWRNQSGERPEEFGQPEDAQIVVQKVRRKAWGRQGRSTLRFDHYARRYEGMTHV